MRRRGLSLEQKKAVPGYYFILPFVIGFILFFVYPITQSLLYSFSSFNLTTEGYTLTNVGWHNYVYAFTVHDKYNRILIGTIRDMITNVPLILIFSFFAANLLNQKFRGRTAARAIFFLPVIMACGIILLAERGDFIRNMLQAQGDTMGMGTSEKASSGLGTVMLVQSLFRTLPQQLSWMVQYISGAVDKIYEVINASGVQMLIFLAGLQSISPSLYEAAVIEGATGWETFWKITFPMISPLIVLSTVYSIIDSFTIFDNRMMSILNDEFFKYHHYGLASAMAWVYFVVIAAILAVVMWIINKGVFYQE